MLKAPPSRSPQPKKNLGLAESAITKFHANPWAVNAAGKQPGKPATAAATAKRKNPEPEAAAPKAAAPKAKAPPQKKQKAAAASKGQPPAWAQQGRV